MNSVQVVVVIILLFIILLGVGWYARSRYGKVIGLLEFFSNPFESIRGNF